jgi:hypothetical protein
VTLYESADLPIRADLRKAHGQVWRELAQPGTWWTAAERIAIAATARRARIEAGYTEGEADAAPTELSDTAREVAAAVGANPGALRRDWFEARVPGLLEEAPYVEAVGVIASSSCIDTFCRGVGLPLHAYPEPVSGDPTHSKPGDLAHDDSAWVAMIPEGTAAGDALYGGPTVNVVRALSQVPEEVGAWMRVAGTQYVPVSVIQEMGEPSDRAIDRTQIELVAGRVSALNECFY